MLISKKPQQNRGVEKKPKVSVIIPTYNRAHLVRRAIRSVLNQTYQDFEVIVVDDCSTDNTAEVLKEFKDNRIKYIRHKVNRGVAAARNTGIKVAEGSYVALLDSDDRWLPSKLEKQMKVFEKAPQEVGVVYTGLWRISSNRKLYIPSPKVPCKYEGDVYKNLLRVNFVGNSSVVIKKECFKKVGLYDEHLPSVEDRELLLRISRYYHFRCVDEPLVILYESPDSISLNYNLRIKVYKLFFKKYFYEIKNDRKALANLYFKIGLNFCLKGDIKKGRYCFLKATITYPFTKDLLEFIISFFSKMFMRKL